MSNEQLASYIGLGSVPIILGLVQVFKALITDTRWYPMIALICGIAINILLALALSSSVITATILGVLAGLAASGLYSASNTLKEGEAAKKDSALHKTN